MNMETVSLQAPPKSTQTLRQGTRRISRSASTLASLRPNFLVRWTFYFSLFAISFSRLYVPGTGDRIGVKRVIQGLLLLAMFSQPRVCLRFIPTALLWFLGYCGLRLAAGLWLSPEYSKMWWPSTLELLQFLLPW